MNDEELCEMFSTTLDDVERDAQAWEEGDFSSFNFDAAIIGRPMRSEPMETISLKVPRSRLEAMEKVAAKEGVSRSEFVRRAIDRELVVTG